MVLAVGTEAKEAGTVWGVGKTAQQAREAALRRVEQNALLDGEAPFESAAARVAWLDGLAMVTIAGPEGVIAAIVQEYWTP